MTQPVSRQGPLFPMVAARWQHLPTKHLGPVSAPALPLPLGRTQVGQPFCRTGQLGL